MQLTNTFQVERALRFWATLPLDAADQPAVKPYNKQKVKAVKMEPIDTPGLSLTEPAVSVRDNRYKIGEFNFDKWSVPTTDWIISAIEHGFDSMNVMQAVIDKANIHINGNMAVATSSRPAVGPESFRRTIMMNDSDSE